MNRRQFVEASGALAFAIVAGAPRWSTRAQTTYSSVDLGLPDGYDSVVPVALNENGVVIVAASAGDKAEIFSLSDGVFTQLGRTGSIAHATCVDSNGNAGGWIEGAGDQASRQDIPIILTSGSQAEMPGRPLDGRVYGLQESGTAVGEAATDAKAAHRKAVIWANQDVSELKGLPSDTASAARDINSLGQIAGWVERSTGGTTQRRAVRLSVDSDPVELGDLGGGQSEAIAISEQGQVAGNSTTSPEGKLGEEGTAAFLWSDGTLTELMALDGQIWSTAADVNSFGLVAGTIGLAAGDGSTTAAVWGHEIVFDLNQSAQPIEGITLVNAVAVDELGQVLCRGVDASGNSHAVLLTLFGN